MPKPTALSADTLFQQLYRFFSQVPEHRPLNVEISLADALMSGFALFSLKDPSLLAFDERRAKPENLQRVYHIQNIPSDTQMRTILDSVAPNICAPCSATYSRPCGAKKYCAGCASWSTIIWSRWMALGISVPKRCIVNTAWNAATPARARSLIRTSCWVQRLCVRGARKWCRCTRSRL